MRKPDKERLVSLLAAGSYEPPGEVERRATELLDEGRVVDGLAGVGETSRRFLAFVARTGGEVGPGAAAWWLNRQQVEDPDAFVEGLASKGLLFYVPAGGLARASDDPAAGALGLGVAGKLWVPEAVGLPAAAQHPPEPLSIASDPAQVIRAEPWEIVRRLFMFGRDTPERGAQASDGSSALRRARTARTAAEPRAGWPAHLGGTARRPAESAPDAYAAWLGALAGEVLPMPGFFERAPVDQRRALVEAAVAQTGWGELEHVSEIVLESPSSARPGRSDIPSPGNRVRARRHILRTLGLTALQQQWHSLSELAEHTMEASPDFLIRRRHARGEAGDAAGPPVYRGMRRSGPAGREPLSTAEDWMAVEGAFVAEFVRGPLHWLGLVDLAGRGGTPLFRLTDLGAAVLLRHPDGDAARAEDPRPEGRFFVQPNFEIMADGGGDNIGAIVRLSRVAELESFDRAALLRVTRESVLRALDAGLRRREIVEALSDGGRVAVPQNVEYSVEEWAAAYDRYELRTDVYVLEADGPAELDALEADLPGCLERIGPTAARVPPDHIAQVEAALAQRTDVSHIDHSQGLTRVFRLDEKMVVTPVPERWHWYPEHLLEQIGERQPGRSRESAGAAPPRFRLTRESVRQGLGGALHPQEIERFIESCADRELTARQRLLLRGWLGRYGAAQLGTATLLAVPFDAAADLLATPELRDQVAGRLGPGVFLVRPKGRLKVKRLLEDAGLEVEDEISPAVYEVPPQPPALSPTQRAESGPRRAATWGRRSWTLGDGEPERMALLEEAVARALALEIGYASVVRGEPPARWEITPHRIERSRWGQVRVHAYCHARDTERAFDLERMTEIRILGPGSTLPLGAATP